MMKIVERNCVKKMSQENKRKSMAAMGERSYISSVPSRVIEVVRSQGVHLSPNSRK